jgi:hypothetical protein
MQLGWKYGLWLNLRRANLNFHFQNISQLALFSGLFQRFSPLRPLQPGSNGSLGILEPLGCVSGCFQHPGTAPAPSTTRKVQKMSNFQMCHGLTKLKYSVCYSQPTWDPSIGGKRSSQGYDIPSDMLPFRATDERTGTVIAFPKLNKDIHGQNTGCEPAEQVDINGVPRETDGHCYWLNLYKYLHLKTLQTQHVIGTCNRRF